LIAVVHFLQAVAVAFRSRFSIAGFVQVFIVVNLPSKLFELNVLFNVYYDN